MKVFLFLGLSWMTLNMSFAQDERWTQFLVFSELSELDTLKPNSEWITFCDYYPSGRKHEEFKVLIPIEKGDTSKIFKISVQHQIYYDLENSPLLIKEGKYGLFKKNKIVYRYFGWWYSSKGDCFRKVKERTVRKVE